MSPYNVCHLMTFVAYDVCRLVCLGLTVWCLSPYDVCSLMMFVAYAVCHLMMFVAYDVFECVAYRVCHSADLSYGT